MVMCTGTARLLPIIKAYQGPVKESSRRVNVARQHVLSLEVPIQSLPARLPRQPQSLKLGDAIGIGGLQG
jgi:hypothetical protein